MSLHLVQEGLDDNATCTLVFLVLYYCGMAGAAWWSVLTLAWYLAAGRQWGAEAIAGLAPYFHLVAWTAPAVQVWAFLGISGHVWADLGRCGHFWAFLDRARRAVLCAAYFAKFISFEDIA